MILFLYFLHVCNGKLIITSHVMGVPGLRGVWGGGGGGELMGAQEAGGHQAPQVGGGG